MENNKNENIINGLALTASIIVLLAGFIAFALVDSKRDGELQQLRLEKRLAFWDTDSLRGNAPIYVITKDARPLAIVLMNINGSYISNIYDSDKIDTHHFIKSEIIPVGSIGGMRSEASNKLRLKYNNTFFNEVRHGTGYKTDEEKREETKLIEAKLAVAEAEKAYTDAVAERDKYLKK